jgi:hypothetical protein
VSEAWEGCCRCNGRAPFGRNNKWFCAEHWLEYVEQNVDERRFHCQDLDEANLEDLLADLDTLVAIVDENDGIIGYALGDDHGRTISDALEKTQ